jgi:AAA+ ATPase superfamily predicted ATPase
MMEWIYQMIGGNKIKLTVNERILLHLRRYYGAKKLVEAPQAVTQKGIADAIDIRVTHVPRSVKKLDEEGMIYESVMHIKGLDKRRKAYFLTEKGMFYANEIKRNIEERRVPYKDENGKVNDVKIEKLHEITGIKVDILDLMRLLDREGVLSRSSLELLVDKTKVLKTEKETKLPEYMHELQVPKKFVGRKKEIDKLQDWMKDGGITLISIQGKSGIGKTSLLGKVLSKVKNENIFYYDFRRGEGFDEMLENLSEFFSRLNRAQLKSILKTKRKGQKDILKGITSALDDTNTILLFDSLDEADSQSKRLFSNLSRDIEPLKGSKLIILQQSSKPYYSKEILDSEHFRSLKLEGLDKKSCKVLLSKKKLDSKDFERIYTLAEGNPRALKLIVSEDVSHLRKTGKFTSDELTLIKYLKSLDKI